MEDTAIHAARAPCARALELHGWLLAASRDHRRAEHRLAKLLHDLQFEYLFEELGYSSVRHYAEAELGLSGRLARDLVRVGRHLVEFPLVDEAFAAGAIGIAKARELVKVCVTEYEKPWVERALAVSVRELERQVALCRRGDPPPDRAARGPARVRMTFELDAADAEVLKRALGVLRARTGPEGDQDDGVLLADLARRALESIPRGAEDPLAIERYRVVLQHCPDCGRQAVGESEASAAVADEAACDAETLDLRAGPERARLGHRIPPALRRAVLERSGVCCSVPLCRNRLFLDVHHRHARADGGTHDPHNLDVLCSIHHRLVHDGLLVIRTDEHGAPVFFAGDGRRIGCGYIEVPVGAPDDLSEYEARALAALGDGVLGGRDLEKASGLTGHAAARVVRNLEAAGAIWDSGIHQWVRTDQVIARWHDGTDAPRRLGGARGRGTKEKEEYGAEATGRDQFVYRCT